MGQKVQHVFIIGSKSIGQYGGFETFVMKLLEYHKDNKQIQYHIACKANGSGAMNVSKLSGAKMCGPMEFTYCNSHCFMIRVPEIIGSAQAIYYDIAALKYCCNYIEKNHVRQPIVYILASRIGPFEKKFVKKIHDAGGKLYQNPDGQEWARGKYSPIVQRYWKYSEQLMIRNCDLVICDSINIQKYICDEYKRYHPRTTYIAYGATVELSPIANNDPLYINWLSKNELHDGQFYTIVGRCVPENNFETIIREFMKSSTSKALVIISTPNPQMISKIEKKLHFSKDKRIKFAGTVYNQDLLYKIRENSYGYIHGHSVGGTNPSLLEALGKTKLNLLLDIGFNREVAEDAALYWNKKSGNLASIIDNADNMTQQEIEKFGEKGKQRIVNAYSWDFIARQYLNVFT